MIFHLDVVQSEWILTSIPICLHEMQISIHDTRMTRGNILRHTRMSRNVGLQLKMTVHNSAEANSSKKTIHKYKIRRGAVNVTCCFRFDRI